MYVCMYRYVAFQSVLYCTNSITIHFTHKSKFEFESAATYCCMVPSLLVLAV
jgi:hypothetical protein